MSNRLLCLILYSIREVVMAEKELVLFESEDKSVSLSVPFENETVWLNRQQMASLFDRDVKTIGKHVNNAIEEELEGI